MRFPLSRMTGPMLCGLLLAVSACAPRERLKPSFPPYADLEAAIEPKPEAPADIVTSAKAAAAYDVAVESWGERVWRAGGRICRWAAESGAKLPFTCPPAPR